MKLNLSVAIGNYDRSRPLIDGRVQIDGVEPIFMTLPPEEIFFRAFRTVDFDICELSLSSATMKAASGTSPYVGVPAFLSRCFRHASIYVRTDRIETPEDLRGKRIGLPEYQLTAMVWARGLLADDYGIRPSDVTWVRGGIAEPGRPEKLRFDLPGDVRLEDTPPNRTISDMLAAGEIDAYMAPRAPALPRNTPHVGWLFADPEAAAKDYYRRTRIFPIMHIVGVRRGLAAQHPWLPAAVLKAFERSKSIAIHQLADVSALKVMLPFVEERLLQARTLMGEDYWSYGIAENRHVLNTFFRHHHAQGLSSRLVTPEDLFHAGTLESPKV